MLSHFISQKLTVQITPNKPVILIFPFFSTYFVRFLISMMKLINLERKIPLLNFFTMSMIRLRSISPILQSVVNLVYLANCKLSRSTNLSINFPKISNLSNILQTPNHSCHQVLLCLQGLTRFFSEFQDTLVTESGHQVKLCRLKIGDFWPPS